MTKSILACCAHEPASTLNAAIYFAQTFGCGVTLLHANEPLCDLLPELCASSSPVLSEALLGQIAAAEAEQGRLSQSAAASMLEASAAVCEAAGVAASVLQLSGDLDECVAAIERDYRLIIAQTAQHEASHAYDLLRAAHTPLMLAAQEFAPPRRVVFAYDGSEALDAALRRSLCAPLFADAERICVHAGRDSERANAVLARARELFGSFGISVRTEQLSTATPAALVDFARAANADTIAMGAYSKGALKHFFAGSFTNDLIAQTAGGFGLFIFR